MTITVHKPFSARMAFYVAIAGVIYGVVRTIVLAFQPWVTSIHMDNVSGSPVTTYTYLFDSQLVQLVAIPLGVLTVTAPSLLLLRNRGRVEFTIYTVTLLVLSFVTGFSIGFFVFPAAGVLVLASILAWMAPKTVPETKKAP